MIYTKLDKSIVFSSIWSEPIHVKVLWITLLAICDQHGEVSAAIPGMAKTAGISIKEAEEALNILMSPDPYDKSGVHGGRRLVKIPGGYEIVNYIDYRNRQDNDVVKEQTRLRVQRHRARKQGKKPSKKSVVTPGNANVTPGNACNANVTPGNAIIGIGIGIGSTSSKEEESNGSAVRPLPEEALKWNAMVEERGKLPKVVSMSPGRFKKLKLRRKSPDWDERFDEALEKVNRSNFCNGENDRGWVASFDWILGSDEPLLKILEGKYDNRTGRPNSSAGKNQPSRFSTKLTSDDAPKSDYSRVGRTDQ